MFRINQIISTTQLVKNFRAIMNYLRVEPQPLLITHRSGRHLVLIAAEQFDQLVSAKLDADGVELPKSGVHEWLESQKL